MVYETPNGIESKICCRVVLDMLEQRRGTIVCSSMLFCIEFGPAFPGVTFLNGSGTSEAVCRGQAQTSSVTRRLMRLDRMETKAISMKATRCSFVRSKIVFNRR